MKSKTRKQAKVRKPKKFRSQFIAKWLSINYEACKVADVGGGKGLLSYLLNKEGWDCTVIDPESQELPEKYTDFDKKKIIIPKGEKIKRINEKFSKQFVKDYDLIIGLHAHGCNMDIIDACKEYGKDFFLMPCCVIDEPIEKREGVDWRNSLFEYAKSLGLAVKQEQFNFKGKNVAVFTDSFLKKKEFVDEEFIKFLTIDPTRRIV